MKRTPVTAADSTTTTSPSTPTTNPAGPKTPKPSKPSSGPSPEGSDASASPSTPGSAAEIDGVLSSLDFGHFEPVDFSGQAGEKYEEGEEDIDHADEDLSFVLPSTQDEFEALHYATLASSLAYYAIHTLRGPTEEPYNGTFLIAEHHEEWSRLVTEHRRLCVLAPRDHGKTFFFDFAYPIWMAWKNPGKCGFIFSATQAQASRILRDIREEIESNPKLADLLPDKFTKWNDHEIRLANGHTIYARGFGTRVRGAHPVWIVCDDVLNDETAYSETVRKKQNDYFFNAVSNMVHATGQLIVVGTPFHSQDLYAEVAERKAYRSCRYSAIRQDGSPLWPERYSLELLRWKRDMDIGPLRFSREFQCEPIADDISLFPSYLFKGPVEHPNIKLGMPLKFWKAMDVTIYMGVDFAISASTQADFTVIWTMGVDPRGNRWIIDIFKAKGMPYRMQRSKIIEYGRRYQPALIFLESNQMQRIFGDELILDTDLPIKKFDTKGLEKHSLEKGLPSIRTLLEARKFRIPRGDERSVRLTNEWISEMAAFIFDGGKVVSVGKHDDMAMACWICDQAIRNGAAFSQSWVAGDVFTAEEMERIKSGEWAPNLDELLGEQIDGKTQFELDQEQNEKRDGLDFGNTVQIVAEEEGDYVPDQDDDEDVDDVFTGQPLPSRKKGGNWKPRESIPIPAAGGGWFRTF
jgi:hypothetical protein